MTEEKGKVRPSGRMISMRITKQAGEEMLRVPLLGCWGSDGESLVKSRSASDSDWGLMGARSHQSESLWGNPICKNINRATCLKVEWGSCPFFSPPPSTTHSPWGNSEKPQRCKNKNSFCRRILKSYCNTSFVLYWVSFPEKHFFEKLVLDAVLLKCATFLPS